MTHLVDIAAVLPLHPHQQDAGAAYDRRQVPSGSRPVWCVVASLPKAERTAHAALHRYGFEAYLPLITIRWRDRTWHTNALWPGYLFVRLDLSRPWHPVRNCPGVYSLLSTNGIPSICPTAVIEALQATEASRARVIPENGWAAPGMPCSLATGAFSGHPAVVLSVGRRKALVAAIMFGGVRQMVVALDNLRQRGE